MLHNPLIILREATKEVPAVKYAYGVLGVAAAVSIVAGFEIDYRVAVFGTIFTFAFMFILFIFSSLTKSKSKLLHFLSLISAYFFMLLAFAVCIMFFLSFFFRYPEPISNYISNDYPEVKAVQPSSKHPEVKAVQPAVEPEPPVGTYSESCKSCRFTDKANQIYGCNCKKRSGGYHWSTIAVLTCGGRIVHNSNGTLKCGR